MEEYVVVGNKFGQTTTVVISAESDDKAAELAISLGKLDLVTSVYDGD
jgi:hypothetical protein